MSKRLSCLPLLALTLLGATTTQAQKTQYGFLGTLKTGTTSYTVRGAAQKTSFVPGAGIGVLAKIPFEGPLYFTPSLSFSAKGFQVVLTDTASNPGIDVTRNNARLYVMELAPLLTLYLQQKGTQPFVQFGPVIDVAGFGTEQIRLNSGQNLSRTMKFAPDAYGRITAGLMVRLGVETPKGVFLSAQYQHGLGSQNNADLGPDIRYRTIGLSFGKIFNRK